MSGSGLELDKGKCTSYSHGSDDDKDCDKALANPGGCCLSFLAFPFGMFVGLEVDSACMVTVLQPAKGCDLHATIETADSEC